MRWFRKKAIADDLKTVTEIAGDQIAPGVGTYALVLGGLAVAAAGAYVLHQTRKKKAAGDPAASSKSDKGD
jgi:hypothetical protein